MTKGKLAWHELRDAQPVEAAHAWDVIPHTAAERAGQGREWRPPLLPGCHASPKPTAVCFVRENQTPLLDVQ